jgi:hypothetical protein
VHGIPRPCREHEEAAVVASSRRTASAHHAHTPGWAPAVSGKFGKNIVTAWRHNGHARGLERPA